MAGRTNTEKIDDIGKQLVILTRDIEHLTADFRDLNFGIKTDLSEQKKAAEALRLVIEGQVHRLIQLEQYGPANLPVLAQRVTHLEKLLDEGRTRRWQVWLAFLGATLTAGAALLIAIVKK
jgi:hypothetical protein